MSSQGPRSAKSNENVLPGDTPTSVNAEARCGATHSTRNTVGRHPSELSPGIGAGPSEVSLGSAHWGGDAERIPVTEGTPTLQLGLALCATREWCGSLLAFWTRSAPARCTKTQKLVASIQVRQVRFGLPMFAVGGAPQRVVTKIARAFVDLWVEASLLQNAVRPRP